MFVLCRHTQNAFEIWTVSLRSEFKSVRYLIDQVESLINDNSQNTDYLSSYILCYMILNVKFFNIVVNIGIKELEKVNQSSVRFRFTEFFLY
jgi:hypothetical protein